MVIYASQNKLNIRHITVLKVGKRLKNLEKPRINHNKNRKHSITPNQQNQDTIEKMRLIPYHPSKNWIPYWKKIDSVTLNLQSSPQDHTWQHLKKSGGFNHSWTKAARLITQMLRFSGEGTVLKYGVTVAKEFDVQEKCKI